MNEPTHMEVGRGVRLAVLENREWVVLFNESIYSLQETGDFYRLVTLLEKPLAATKAEIDEAFKKLTDLSDFPYWKVAVAGLKMDSEEWAALALRWLPDLNSFDGAEMKEALLRVAKSKWASQRTRQLAMKWLRSSLEGGT